jgi:hypothetical protein
VDSRIQDFAKKPGSDKSILTPGRDRANASFPPVAWVVGTACKRLPVTID